MELTWYGLSCFRLSERGAASVVTDPYSDEFGYELPRPRGEIITISCDEATRNAAKAVRGPSRVLDGPGEYEIGGVFVTGVALIGSKPRKDAPRRNVVFTFEYDGVTLCHLGGLNHIPSQSQIEALGAVDILLTPVGGGDLISTAQAAEVITMLEPSLVIPMHYHVPPIKLWLPRLAAFLEEMGSSKVESLTASR